MVPTVKNARLERIILGAVLGVVMLAAWMDGSSETASRMRSHAPLTAWLALRGTSQDLSKPPAIYLLVYKSDESRQTGRCCGPGR
jgi:hypothetical protein